MARSAVVLVLSFLPLIAACPVSQAGTDAGSTPDSGATSDAGPTACGGQGQACCNGGACDNGLECGSTLICAVPSCGGSGQVCCVGAACDNGLSCEGLVCTGPDAGSGSDAGPDIEPDAGPLSSDAGAAGDGGAEPDAGTASDAGSGERLDAGLPLSDGGAAGDGGAIADAGTVQGATAPGVPIDVVAVAGIGSATISWNPPSSDGGADIIRYTVTASAGGFSMTTVSSSVTLNGLTPGSIYWFVVSATNSVGSGAFASSNEVTIPTAPGAPTGVTATPSDASATVAWTAPSSNGGEPVTGYAVLSTPGSIVATTTGATQVKVSGLTNGTSYTFTVTAANIVGTGTSSSPSPPVTPAAVPSAPGNVVAMAVATSATINWTAPSSDGGSAITGYTVRPSGGGSPVAVTTPGATVTGLTRGTVYTFAVSAMNAAGTGPSAQSNAITISTPPGAPTGVLATPGLSAATVSWTAPPNGGSPITSYSVTPSGAGATVRVTTTSATVTGLTGGASYTFAVTATNVAGTGPAGESNTITLAGVPGAPTAVSARAESGFAWVSFMPPSSNGGSPITEYTVTSSPGDVMATTTGFDVAVDGLSDGQSYTFTVTATNAVGTGPASAASAPVTPKVCQAQPEPGIPCLDRNICTLSEQCTSPDYTVTCPDTASDCIVTDNVTGFIWQQTVPAAMYNQAAAATYCTGLDYGGESSGWRLPTIDELFTLVVYGGVPQIDQSAFPDTTDVDWFWTSTTNPQTSDGVWGISFNNGSTLVEVGTSPAFVRCVR